MKPHHAPTLSSPPPPVLPIGGVPAMDGLTAEERFVQRFVQCRTPELFNDRIYTAADWDRHVTWYRHLPEPSIFLRVFQAALPLIVWTTTFSVAIGLYFFYLEPLGAPKIVQDRNYAPVLQVASTALALLLVFRTNSSYGRWQEGRQLFGLTLNHARNLARLACGTPSTTTTTTPVAAVLTAHELALVERATLERGVPAPITLAQAISQLFSRAGCHPIDRQAAESQLSAYDIALGGCQRLAGSPLPCAYTRHTSRFLIAYLMLLPVTLFPSLGWLTILVVILLTFFLGGIENVGVQIENPLRILPLRAFAAAYRDAALGIGAVAGQCADWASAVAATASAAGGTAEDKQRYNQHGG